MTAPKFKVGDRVRALETYTGRDTVTKGSTYAVAEVFSEYMGHKHNYARLAGQMLPWSESMFTLVEEPTLKTPSDHATRKGQPIARGVLDYFPDAIKAVAECSRVGNDQHNPGQDMHHARSKSSDHADCVVRHLMERGTVDTDGVRHSAKVAWRALALLQEELEAAGAPKARGAK